MANDSTDFFYFYRRYKVRAVDMTAFQEAMIELPRGLAEGLVGSGVLSGFDVTVLSGLNLFVTPGISVGGSGYLGVVNTITDITIPASAVGASPSRSLIVVSPAPLDTNYIASPTAPFSSVPLNQSQKAVVKFITGTPALNPSYPAKGANDVILCGVMLAPGTTNLSPEMIDFEIRDTVGTHSQIQKNQNHLDDRLRPFRFSSKILAIKSSQTHGSNSKLFSYPSKSTPSLFPLLSGVHNDSDTSIDMSTGSISGGDGTSSPFTPVIPTGNNSVTCAICLTANDTLLFFYGNQGTFKQCQAAIVQQTTTGAGSVPSSNGLYTICYAIVSSFGSAYSDVQVIDTRPLGGGGGGGSFPIFQSDLLGYGTGIATSFSLSKTPKDSSSVLIFADGVDLVSGTDYTLVGTSVSFFTAPGAGQNISAYYIVDGPSTISGHQEQPTVMPDGITTTFPLSLEPADQNSVLLFLDGVALNPSQWTLLVSAGTSSIQFKTAPVVGQKIWVFFCINLVPSGQPNPSPGSSTVETHGTFAAPIVIDPATRLVPTNAPDQAWWITPLSGGPGLVPVSGVPQISVGSTAGQRLAVFGVTNASGGYFGFINDPGNGVYQNGDLPFPSGQCVVYMWNGSAWQFISQAI